ncbi:MAG: site-specific integrase [Methylotenera sp.]|nr:site-specific integrase [Methylotenera sp.]MDP2404360.1 site-specific integrase [Methylotenera sp.]MDP3096023.1 site-specific integrase [Methylotenera sp.]MDZ4223707.1 site-specific integrase [Methylotenera sp.]
MGGFKLVIYNHESDLWEGKDGRLFIKNEYDPLNPCLIEITGNIWQAVWKGRLFKISWKDLSISKDVIYPIQMVATAKLKSSKVAATYILALKYMLFQLQRCLPSACCSLNDFGVSEFSVIWAAMTPTSRSLFRDIYQKISENSESSADSILATRIKKWKARSDVKTLKNVVSWNPLRGSLTSAELELLRVAVNNQPLFESDKFYATRLLCRILIETIKRPEQILSINSNGLIQIQSKLVIEYFLKIPKAKAQTGEDPELWGISDTLAKELIAYSERPSIKALQARHNRLIVWEMKSLTNYGQIASQDAKQAIICLVNKFNIHSPRTKDKLHVTPYRIRHTGATRMVMQGVSRDILQHILEHDDPSSAQAYINAIGSDLVPAIERADRKLGGLFKELNDIFFKGKVVTELGKAKVFIPIFNAALMPVGSCGKDSLNQGSCKKQPFIACYDGCSNFLAWKEADHTKSLEYVEIELERWSQAEGHNERSKAIKDYERLHHAITEVIRKIQAIESDAIS